MAMTPEEKERRRRRRKLEEADYRLNGAWDTHRLHPWKRKLRESAYPRFIEMANEYIRLPAPGDDPSWKYAMLWIRVAAEMQDDDRIREGLELAGYAVYSEWNSKRNQEVADRWDESRAFHQREDFMSRIDAEIRFNRARQFMRTWDPFKPKEQE